MSAIGFFCENSLTANFFLQESLIVDVRLGPKYAYEDILWNQILVEENMPGKFIEVC